MQLRNLLVLGLLFAGLAGCGDSPDATNDCEPGFGSCLATQFSCPAASNCYGSERLCVDSGECD